MRMANKIKAILFDIGGTLVHKQNHGYRDDKIINRMAQLLDVDLTPQELIDKISKGEGQYRSWRQRTFIELSPVERWGEYYLPDLPRGFINDNAELLQKMWSESRGKRWITRKTIATIQELSRRGYRLGTVSHTSPHYLVEAGVAKCFTTNLHSAAFGKRKPHPSIFITAARQCGASPQECAFVGDRPTRDVVGSREAGFARVILLRNESSTTEAEACPMKADEVIGNIEELLSLFPEMADQTGVEIPDIAFPFLYDAALSTMWWDQEKDSSETFFSRGRSLGFARFELNHHIPSEVFDSLPLDRFHIGTLHDPCPAFMPFKVQEQQDLVVSAQDETRRQKGVDIAKRTIDHAFQLRARSVVFHPGHITGDHSLDDSLRALYNQGLKGSAEYEKNRKAAIKDRAERSKPFFDATLRSLRDIVQHAQGSGVSLGFENRFHFYELPDFEEMKTILVEFPQPWVGWQFDVGHLQVHETLGLMSMSSWLENFSQRIIGVHFHDVQGIKDHCAPGTGDVDFGMISKYVPADAQSTLEIDMSCSSEEMRLGLEVLHGSQCIVRL